MDTNLKKGKKIRAFLYRMLAMGAFVMAIAVAVMGREAFVNAAKCENRMAIFRGDFYELPEFREYIGKLYRNAMLGYAGVGDSNGYPLTDSNAAGYSLRARQEFSEMLGAVREDIYYYVRLDDEKVKDNVSFPLFSEYDGQLLLPEDVRLCCYWDGANETLHYFDGQKYVGGRMPTDVYEAFGYRPNKENAAKMQIIFALKENPSSLTLRTMQWKAECYRYVMIWFCIAVGLWFVFGVCSLFTGKAAKAAKAEYADKTVKVWFEVKLVIFLLTIFFYYWYGMLDVMADLNVRMENIGLSGLYFMMGCLVHLILTDFKQNKESVFLNCLPVKTAVYIKEFLHAVPWYKKALGWNLCTLAGAVMLVICSICLAKRTFIYTPAYLVWFMLALSVLLLYGFIRQSLMLRDTQAVVKKLSKMKEGQENEPLKLPKNSLLTDAARDLNELEDGIENAVEQRNRSNRMKVELLTNVSHDLKTPLTSIVNYADLLCEEELPDDAAEYAKALQQKAYRLKKMVQDVFDLSKATSGNLVVEKAVIDLAKLIRQTLADMDERITESDLTFKLNISKEPLLIEADGEKLYRVFQNLFVNALQYSLENSRVHVQLTEEDGFAVARVKNVSRMELDFDEKEIVERFVRADSSRTTEGSGLGLSIVQSFTEACGGVFYIETDADMFTACVRFPLTEQNMAKPQTEVPGLEDEEEQTEE